jgi:caffeoyl-CoA O-methyltransferase
MIVSPDVESWMLNQHRSTDSIEQEMRRRGEEGGFPLIGPMVGQLCSVLAQSIGAKRVFEMGSGFGYSAWWFARAVGPDGHVIHTDGDATLSSEAQGYLGRAGLAQRVSFVVGDAVQALEAEPGPFDIVYIDIDKGDYPAAWAAAAQKVRKGGMIITDNTLWSGKVADPTVSDDWTDGIREYVAMAFADARFATTIIPLRDGVCVSLRIE